MCQVGTFVTGWPTAAYSIVPVQCTVCSVQCTTVYSVQCTLYNVQCTVDIVQCIVYSLHCVCLSTCTYSKRYSAYSILHCTLRSLAPEWIVYIVSRCVVFTLYLHINYSHCHQLCFSILYILNLVSGNLLFSSPTNYSKSLYWVLTLLTRTIRVSERFQI